MNPSLFLAILCFGMASPAPKLDHSLEAQWQEWKAKHRKTYDMNEEGKRKAEWEKNMKMIELHNGEYNQGKHSFIMAMNVFGDMTRAEFSNMVSGFQNQKHKKGKVFQKPLFGDVPKSVDWRKKGYVTAVKHQNRPCRYNPQNSVANDKGFIDIPEDEEALMKAVATVGPISVAIDAEHDSFKFYKGGIYYNPHCSNTSLSHAVLVVGYGFEGAESDNKKYWLIKNSWGEKWGMNGYMKIARNKNNHCGIASDASYPLV
ncbi:procathepsin L isoform X7 [Urocitellus parryii]